jgi:endonuclease/exonuclease/phosphatase family metal-dependent hydrolase
LAYDLYDEDSKKITGKAIREIDADIVCLQEIENLLVLERFNSQYLGGMGYKHRMLIDSHDMRHIDVAVISRYPFAYVNTHRHERNKANTTWKFSRDCLEVDFEINDKRLSLYINHLKSMMYGRAETKARRQEQAERVADIIDGYWKGKKYEGNFACVGDLNDYIDAKTSLKALASHPQLVNVVDRLPKADRWTHFWADGGEYRQLDYIFLSKTLADASNGNPGIERQGLPWRAERYSGPRFSDVGENNPKASDHCPVYMDINLA